MMAGTRGERVRALRVHKNTGMLEFRSSKSPDVDAAKLWKWPLDTVRACDGQFLPTLTTLAWPATSSEIDGFAPVPCGYSVT